MKKGLKAVVLASVFALGFVLFGGADLASASIKNAKVIKTAKILKLQKAKTTEVVNSQVIIPQVISKEQEWVQLYQKGINVMTAHDNLLSYKYIIDSEYLNLIKGLMTTEEIDFYWDLHDKLLLEADYYFGATDLYQESKTWLREEDSYTDYKSRVDNYYLAIIHELRTTEEIDVYWDQRDRLLLEAKTYYNYKEQY